MSVFSNCQWIGVDAACASPVLMRSFSAAKPEKAILTITGLGYFEAKINGKPITDSLLLPVVSDYAPRDMTKFLYPIYGTTTNRVYYYTFDVTPWLTEGGNILSIQLGNGWYRQKARTEQGKGIVFIYEGAWRNHNMRKLARGRLLESSCVWRIGKTFVYGCVGYPPASGNGRSSGYYDSSVYA